MIVNITTTINKEHQITHLVVVFVEGDNPVAGDNLVAVDNPIAGDNLVAVDNLVAGDNRVAANNLVALNILGLQQNQDYKSCKSYPSFMQILIRRLPGAHIQIYHFTFSR